MSAARSRTAASVCSTITVSAMGTSSRYSSRVSNDVSTDAVAGRDHGESVAHVVREALGGSQPVGQDACLLVSPEDEQRERRRVPPDRGLRPRGALRERPLGLARGTLGVSREDPRLHRTDRPAPAPRRRVLPALAVATRRPGEPLRGTGRIASSKCSSCWSTA